jgi:hypothetical protein
MAETRRWEYLWVMCRSENDVDVVYRINGEDLAETQKQRANHFLEAAGVGGWELVSSAGHGSEFCASLWFKRAIA